MRCQQHINPLAEGEGLVEISNTLGRVRCLLRFLHEAHSAQESVWDEHVSRGF